MSLRYDNVAQMPPGLRAQVAAQLIGRPAPRQPLPAWLSCGHDGCDVDAGCDQPGRWQLTVWERPWPTNRFSSGKRRDSIAAKTRWFEIGRDLGRLGIVPRLRRFYLAAMPVYRRGPVVDVDGCDLTIKHLVDGLGTRWDPATGALLSAGVFPDDRPAGWDAVTGRWTGRGWWCGKTVQPARYDRAAPTDRIEITVWNLRVDQENPWT